MSTNDSSTPPELASFTLRQITDHAILFISLDGHIRTWNEGAERIFGFSATEAIGKHVRLIFVDRDIAEGVPEREMEKALADGKAEDERWHRRSDRSSVYVSGSTLRLDQSGRPVGFAKVARDFTSRKENEHRAAVLSEVMQVLAEESTLQGAAPRLLDIIGSRLRWDGGGIWIHDEMSDTLTCRHAWLAASAAESSRELTRRRIHRGEGAVGQVWASDSAIWIPDIDGVGDGFSKAEAGTRQFASAVAFPIRAHSEAIGVIEFFSREVRDRDRDFLNISATIGTLLGYFIEREQRERELRDASRAKDYLIARVSHDLRAPLTAIKGWTHLLRNRDLDEETYDTAVTTIEDSVLAQESLIDELLDASRLAFGQIRLEREAIDLVELLDTVARTFSPAAETRRLAFRWIPERARAVVLADPQRILQVFRNLVGNALKFTPPGGEIAMKLELEQTIARVTVSDTGEGIAAEALRTIFEPFRQVEPGRREENSGLGLGLAIVHELVALHGGSVRAESEGRGSGATFIVELPLASAMR